MLEQVAEELRDIGLESRIVDFPSFPASRRAVVLDIDVQHGRYKGRYSDARSELSGECIPRVPTALRPPQVVHQHSDRYKALHARLRRREEWSAYSLPPSDFWDSTGIIGKEHEDVLSAAPSARSLLRYEIRGCAAQRLLLRRPKTTCSDPIRRGERQEDLCFALWRPSTGASRTTGIVAETPAPVCAASGSYTAT